MMEAITVMKPGHYKQPKRSTPNRRCERCSVRLSIYNHGTKCHVHKEVR